MFKLFFKYSYDLEGNYCECEPTIVFFRVSSKTISEFRDSFFDQFRSDFLGNDWQTGNSGGLTYQIIEENIILRENDELIKLEFLQKDAKFYLEKNKCLEKVELAEFESANFISKFEKIS